MSLALTLYNHLPAAFQNLACSWRGWRDNRVRYGRTFHRQLETLLATERLSAAAIDQLQAERLRVLVRSAYNSVPYYRELMRARGLTPADIRTAADLPKLPVLTKEDLRASFGRLTSVSAPRSRLILRHTSGTTGKAVNFYSTPDSIGFQWAVWWRHRMRFGLRPGDLHANFIGQLVVPPAQARPPYWRWNRPARQALLNMHHITPAHIRPIVAFLGSFPFAFYSGYPSIIHTLAAIALEQGLALDRSPRVVATGAEPLYDFQRRDILRLTGAVITDQWGFSEGAGNASQCEFFRYHEDFEFGILECVDPETLPDGRVRGRIVCTGFANDAFPLIRYQVGDIGVWEPRGFRCECGRESAVLAAVEGRLEDYIVTPEGRHVMRFDYIFKETTNVKECQVVQHAPDAITLRVVRRPSYSGADERLLTSEIARWISPSLRVGFEYVDEIERQPNGKFRAVKSLLGSVPCSR